MQDPAFPKRDHVWIWRESDARECVRASEVQLQKSLSVSLIQRSACDPSREHREPGSERGRGSSAQYSTERREPGCRCGGRRGDEGRFDAEAHVTVIQAPAATRACARVSLNDGRHLGS